MIDHTINDADQGVRSVPKPVPENIYGQTIADSGAATPTGSTGRSGGAGPADYQVVHVIGQGAMGTISLAKHVRLDR